MKSVHLRFFCFGLVVVGGSGFASDVRHCPSGQPLRDGVKVKGTRLEAEGVGRTFEKEECRRSELLALDDDALLAKELIACGGEIIDPHLHIAPWFDDADTLIDELKASNVTIGLLYNPYPNIPLPFDVNTYAASIAASSGGKIYALASLNTTHTDWQEHRDYEINRLRTFLEKDEVLGAKLAPANTALPLTGQIMDDVIETLAKSSKSVLAIHMGTTAFCGPIGEQFGIKCNCTKDFVDPSLLIPKIEEYPDIQFILLHSGHEFLPPDSPYYYNFEFSDKCIAMAKTYPNVFLSLSAVFAQEPDGTLKYPGGQGLVKKMKQSEVTHKVFWASDASYKQGQIRPVLITALRAMIQAGWTQEERTWAMNGCARHVFKIPVAKAATPSASIAN
jgi:hypothetical protein